jgi:hypothetical protein
MKAVSRRDLVTIARRFNARVRKAIAQVPKGRLKIRPTMVGEWVRELSRPFGTEFLRL